MSTFTLQGNLKVPDDGKIGSNTTVNAITIDSTGNVGIGTSSHNAKLHVNGFVTYDSNLTYIFNNIGDIAAYEGNANVSIYATNSMAAGSFITQSDSRIKKDIELVSDTEALNLVNALESKKYFYKDPARQTENKIIGFLAQDVKEVLPSAVKNNTEFIPDELRDIPASNFNGTTLTVDNIVWEESHTGMCRFVVSDDEEGTNEERIDLVCNKDENDNYNGEFTFEKAWNKIIFYGKEITDFQIIDKPQIFALHHSAIQELSRQLDTEKAKVVTLQNDLTAEKAKTATLETKVTTLESQVADLLTRVTALENP